MTVRLTEQDLATLGYIEHRGVARRRTLNQRPRRLRTPPPLVRTSARQATPQTYQLWLGGLRLESEANIREHWAATYRRTQDHRYRTYIELRATGWGPPPLPLVITLTRVAPSGLDAGDNLPASAKACRDGVSDWLAGGYLQGQDRQKGLEWRYAQRRGGVREYGVEIYIRQGEE